MTKKERLSLSIIILYNNQLLVSLVYINISKTTMNSQPNYRMVRVIGSGVFGTILFMLGFVF